MPKLSSGKEKLHQPVLENEVCEGMKLPGKKIVVDGTLGLGGHSKVLLQNFRGKIVAFEVDKDNLKVARKNLRIFKERVLFVHSNFSMLEVELQKLNIEKVDGILLDLGLSSVHVDDAKKGFSFSKDGPLDMRFDTRQAFTAADIVNRYSQKQLLRIFREYGEEPYAFRLSQEISKARRKQPFETTLQLAQFIEGLVKKKSHIHPATRVFQALRMEVNHELDVLQSVLSQAVSVLHRSGRIVVISYHSLEDRVVKRFFLAQSRHFINLPGELTTTYLEPSLKIITQKPIVPSATEIKKNPRSRSAKLRIAERI